MKCGNCGGTFQPFHGDLDWEEKFAGAFLVRDVTCEKCDRCGEVLLPLEACRKVDAARAEKLEQWLANRPLKDFWDSSQTREFLGISRQALSKGVQIANLVYKTERNGKFFYLAESVRKFKATGDGRLPLDHRPEVDIRPVHMVLAGDTEERGAQYVISEEREVGLYLTSEQTEGALEVAEEEAHYA